MRGEQDRGGSARGSFSKRGEQGGDVRQSNRRSRGEGGGDKENVLFCVADGVQSVRYTVSLQDDTFMAPTAFAVRFRAVPSKRNASKQLDKGSAIYGTFSLYLVDGRQWMPWSQYESLGERCGSVAYGIAVGSNNSWKTTPKEQGSFDLSMADDVRIARTTLLSALYAWSLIAASVPIGDYDYDIDSRVASEIGELRRVLLDAMKNGADVMPLALCIALLPAPDDVHGIRYIPFVGLDNVSTYVSSSSVCDALNKLGVSLDMSDVDIAVNREEREAFAKKLWENIGLETFISDIANSVDVSAEELSDDAVMIVRRMLALFNVGSEYIFRNLGQLTGMNVVVRQEAWNNKTINKVFLERRKKVYHVGP
jgi:hypothetical protein